CEPTLCCSDAVAVCLFLALFTFWLPKRYTKVARTPLLSHTFEIFMFTPPKLVSPLQRAVAKISFTFNLKVPLPLSKDFETPAFTAYISLPEKVPSISFELYHMEASAFHPLPTIKF